MALTAAQAEQAEWSGRRGDDISREWTRTTGDREYDSASLVVQIRDGGTEADTLVASTANGDGYDAETHALITTTGTDFDGDPIVFAWQCARAQYLRLPAGSKYTIEAQCEIDGDLTTFMRHSWRVLPQVAVEAS